MRRVNADADKLVAEGTSWKRRSSAFLRIVVREAWTIGLAVFRGGSGRAKLGWPREADTLQRHEALRSGRKVDRNWWYATKLGMVTEPVDEK